LNVKGPPERTRLPALDACRHEAARLEEERLARYDEFKRAMEDARVAREAAKAAEDRRL
jgi:hypothetical protein